MVATAELQARAKEQEVKLEALAMEEAKLAAQRAEAQQAIAAAAMLARCHAMQAMCAMLCLRRSPPPTTNCTRCGSGWSRHRIAA